nr:MAG TPA: hypothetical protein [Caudoviricetes sp.]
MRIRGPEYQSNIVSVLANLTCSNTNHTSL